MSAGHLATDWSCKKSPGTTSSVVTTLFVWLVGNQINKVFVIPCPYKPHFYVIFCTPYTGGGALFQKEKDSVFSFHRSISHSKLDLNLLFSI